MMIAGLLIAASLQAATSCHMINNDRIYGRDLAAVEPAFRALPPDLEVGLSPVPGQQRTFRPDELTRIAQANQLDAVFTSPACFGWEMAVPSRTDLLTAMKEGLGNRNGNVEVIDQSNNLLPHGKLVFPLSGLSGFSDGPVVWRGSLVYGTGRALLTWARVRISVKEQYVASAEPLKVGDEVRLDQLKLVSYEGPLPREQRFTSLSQVVGMTPRSTINPDSLLTNSMLRERKQVERGDLVQVTVRTERTKVEAQGVAEESGSCGSLITVRNAKSGRRFRARVQERGKVLVVAEGPTGLATEEGSK